MLPLSEILVRRRLAGRVDRLSRTEREERHRATIVEFGAMRTRRDLYDELGRRVRDRRQPLPDAGLRALEAFLAEDPPSRDYGSNARARNERIARVLAGLDGAS